MIDLLFSSVNRVFLQYKETALYYAATMGHGLIAKYLISECEANVNCEDHVNRRSLYGNSHDVITISYQWGKTILMAACARGDESLVRSIVSKGFDVNARDEVHILFIDYFSAVLIVFLYRIREQLCTMQPLMVAYRLQRI